MVISRSRCLGGGLAKTDAYDNAPTVVSAFAALLDRLTGCLPSDKRDNPVTTDLLSAAGLAEIGACSVPTDKREKPAKNGRLAAFLDTGSSGNGSKGSVDEYESLDSDPVFDDRRRDIAHDVLCGLETNQNNSN